MKENNLIDKFITCPKYCKTRQMTKDMKTCPYCGDLITDNKHLKEDRK